MAHSLMSLCVLGTEVPFDEFAIESEYCLDALIAGVKVRGFMFLVVKPIHINSDSKEFTYPWHVDVPS